VPVFRKAWLPCFYRSSGTPPRSTTVSLETFTLYYLYGFLPPLRGQQIIFPSEIVTAKRQTALTDYFK